MVDYSLCSLYVDLVVVVFNAILLIKMELVHRTNILPIHALMVLCIPMVR